MIINQRYLGQEELKYVYERGKKRIESHPELAEKYKKMIDNFAFYVDRDEAIKAAMELSESNKTSYQVWAKVGKKERYYLEDYYIVSDDYRILIAAEYIGMEQLFR